MVRAHEEHPFSVDVIQRKRSDIVNRIAATTTEGTDDKNPGPKQKKQRTLFDTIVVNPDEVRVLVTRWLLSSGLPHTVLQNNELLDLLRRLSNQSNLFLPARETFYAFAEGEFNLFVNYATRSLQAGFAALQQEPFISVMHDSWTNAANMNIIGVTVQFINSEWRLVTLFVFALPNSNDHAASIVADMMQAGFQSRYKIDITKYARFTVSDTTGSARNVSDHFSSTDQVDCLMHLLSLCLLYGLGLKENTRNDGRDVVTPGGKFAAGNHVIQKLRDLATFFSKPDRLAKLKKIKEIFHLPAVNVAIDAKTRVGYAVTLMRRSIYNCYAFNQYFESAPPSERLIWSSITSPDWQLIREMEGLTDQFAQFSLGEVQKKGVASSYALLFRKLLTLGVEADLVSCLVLERPDPTENEFTQRREGRRVQESSEGGKICRDRLCKQLQLRFPHEDINEIKALLLNPRVKGNAALYVSDKQLLAQAEEKLQAAMYQKRFSRRGVDEEHKISDQDVVQPTRSEPSATNSAISALLEIDVPDEVSNPGDIHEDMLMNALNSWNYWKSFRVKWANATTTRSKYNVLELYRDVDVLEWFKNHGELEFPGVAALAKIYLAHPLSTATHERCFSLSGYVVFELRTRLDDDRAEMLCLMKANWGEYKDSLNQA